MSRLGTCLLLACLALLSACGSTARLAPGEPFRTDLDVNQSRKAVFDVLLDLTHAQHMRPTEASPSSGVLVLEPLTFPPKQMDTYCLYPAKYEDGSTATTFVKQDELRKGKGESAVQGTLSLSFLVKELSAKSCNLSLSAVWTVPHGERVVECASLGVYEKEFMSALEKGLGDDADADTGSDP